MHIYKKRILLFTLKFLHQNYHFNPSTFKNHTRPASSSYKNTHIPLQNIRISSAKCDTKQTKKAISSPVSLHGRRQVRSSAKCAGLVRNTLFSFAMRRQQSKEAGIRIYVFISWSVAVAIDLTLDTRSRHLWLIGFLQYWCRETNSGHLSFFSSLLVCLLLMIFILFTQNLSRNYFSFYRYKGCFVRVLIENNSLRNRTKYRFLLKKHNFYLYFRHRKVY